MQSADNINRNLIQTSLSDGHFSFVGGYSFISGEITPTKEGMLVGRYINTGESLFFGVSNTWILHDFYGN